jgi:hypothetical protein
MTLDQWIKVAGILVQVTSLIVVVLTRIIVIKTKSFSIIIKRDKERI